MKNLKNIITQAGLEYEGIADKEDLIALAREARKKAQRCPRPILDTITIWG